MDVFRQFDRFVEDLRERQYAPLAACAGFEEEYALLGNMWRERLWAEPPPGPKSAAAVAAGGSGGGGGGRRHRHTNKNSKNKSKSKSGNSGVGDAPPFSARVGPHVPPGRALMRETFGKPGDGLTCQYLSGLPVSEDGAVKTLMGGDGGGEGSLTLSTRVDHNATTGAPTDFVYTLRNGTLRDVEVVLDFAESEGVVAVTVMLKQERGSRITTVVPAGETAVGAWLRPKKKKSMFAWENLDGWDDDADGGGGGSRRKKKPDQVIRLDVSVRRLWSREVSFQLLTERVSAVHNARGGGTGEYQDSTPAQRDGADEGALLFAGAADDVGVLYYFEGRPDEDVYAWASLFNECTRVDEVTPETALGRLVAFTRSRARRVAVQTLKSLRRGTWATQKQIEEAGANGYSEERNALLLNRATTVLVQVFGPHNAALRQVCGWGAHMQIKQLLDGDGDAEDLDAYLDGQDEAEEDQEAQAVVDEEESEEGEDKDDGELDSPQATPAAVAAAAVATAVATVAGSGSDLESDSVPGENARVTTAVAGEEENGMEGVEETESLVIMPGGTSRSRSESLEESIGTTGESKSDGAGTDADTGTEEEDSNAPLMDTFFTPVAVALPRRRLTYAQLEPFGPRPLRLPPLLYNRETRRPEGWPRSLPYAQMSPFYSMPRHGRGWQGTGDANPNSLYGGPGGTALHAAARGGHAHVCTSLLARGWSPMVTDTQGRTPHEVAEHAGHTRLGLQLRRIYWGESTFLARTWQDYLREEKTLRNKRDEGKAGKDDAAEHAETETEAEADGLQTEASAAVWLPADSSVLAEASSQPGRVRLPPCPPLSAIPSTAVRRYQERDRWAGPVAAIPSEEQLEAVESKRVEPATPSTLGPMGAVSLLQGVRSAYRRCVESCANAKQIWSSVEASLEAQGVLVGMKVLEKAALESRQLAKTCKLASEKSMRANLLVNGRPKETKDDDSDDDDDDSDTDVGSGGSEHEDAEAGGSEAKDATKDQMEKKKQPKKRRRVGKNGWSAETDKEEKERLAQEKADKEALMEASWQPADNYEMLNLFHVCFAGDFVCLSLALRRGHRLRFLAGSGWRSIPTHPPVNYMWYRKHTPTIHGGVGGGRQWTDVGGVGLVHALVSQLRATPAPWVKPCLLLLLDLGWAGNRLDSRGRTPADYAKSNKHTAIRAVMRALIRDPPTEATAAAAAAAAARDSDDSFDSDEDEFAGQSVDRAEAHKLAEAVRRPGRWECVRSATESENRILFGLCSGVCSSGDGASLAGIVAGTKAKKRDKRSDTNAHCGFLVREAVLYGKALFTHGSRLHATVGCRRKDGDIYPVRYNTKWTCRFEPTTVSGTYGDETAETKSEQLRLEEDNDDGKSEIRDEEADAGEAAGRKEQPALLVGGSDPVGDSKTDEATRDTSVEAIASSAPGAVAVPRLEGLGWTCLHLAALAGQYETVAILLAAGWDLNACTMRGHTAADLARFMGHEALHAALVACSEIGTVDFFSALRKHVPGRVKWYTNESEDLSEQVKAAAEKCEKVLRDAIADKKAAEDRAAEEKEYEGLSPEARARRIKMKEEKRRQAELKKERRAKRREARAAAKRRRSLSPPGSPGSAGSPGSPGSPRSPGSEAGAEAEDETAAAAAAVAAEEAAKNKKTFFRGRLRFRPPALKPKHVASWTCLCTTTNSDSAPSCKHCGCERPPFSL